MHRHYETQKHLTSQEKTTHPRMARLSLQLSDGAGEKRGCKGKART